MENYSTGALRVIDSLELVKDERELVSKTDG